MAESFAIPPTGAPGSPGAVVVAAKSRNHAVLMETVDHSIEAAREARARSEAARAEREREEARLAADEAARRRRAEEVERADAERLVEQLRAEAESAANQTELLTGRRPLDGAGVGLDLSV